ncbi:DUF305 domain-containing protein [Spirillospora sp. NPDC029432]|uniref:DUF305 domain-containing protein n=1 Tax=Spirillospora sp. NPDC029432 TaxID=3154599 RepID=UPI0034563B02
MRQRIWAAAMAPVLVMGVLAGCSGEPEGKAAPSATVLQPGRPGEPNKTAVKGPATPAPPTEAEIRFVEMMIPHHQQALEMSVLAPGQAKSAQVKSLAERIKAGQGAEIGAMRAWLGRNGRASTSGHGGHGAHGKPSAGAGDHAGMPGMATPEQMARLKAARGAEFDRLFLTLMITHHQGALTMAEGALDKGTDVVVQELARDVQSGQQAEINRMRALLAE